MKKSGEEGTAPRLRAPGLVRWGKRGAWAIADQGLFAVTNFGVSVWLARALDRAEYGAFALGFTLLLLSSACFLGLLGEPLSVFGPGKYKDRFQEYVGATVAGWALVASVVFVLFAGLSEVSTTLAASWGLGDLPLVLGVVAPTIALLRMLRMGCYASLRPHVAAMASLVNLLCVSGAMFMLRDGGMTAARGFWALALGATPAIVGLALALRVRLPGRGSGGFVSSVFSDHVEFGRWSLGANLLMWVPGNAVYFFVTHWAGVDVTGVLRALRNLTTPVMHAIYALTTVLMPKLVAARHSTMYGYVVRISIVLFLALAVGYWGVVSVLSEWLLSLVYSGGYDGFSSELILLALVPVVSSVAAVFSAALRAEERPRAVFAGNVCSATFTLTVGAGFVFAWGLAGAVAAVLLSTTTLAITLALLQEEFELRSLVPRFSRRG